jgi:ubiquinone/menaquinone biosynthesis C-methylase UbiE
MLHVAPELCFESRFRQVIGSGYLTADLFAEGADVKMDITDICFPEGSFDLIYCSHVLEHVPDDKKAMREFYRVLKSGGWAVLLVPITVELTLEDPNITVRRRDCDSLGKRIMSAVTAQIILTDWRQRASQ